MSDINVTTATGDEIADVIDAIDDATQGFPMEHVMMAGIVMAIAYQFPEATPDQLSAGVREVSQVIALYVSSLKNTTKTPKHLLN